MAIAFRASNTAGNGNGTTLAITKPTGTVDNDIVIINVYFEAPLTTPAISGFTLVQEILETSSTPDMSQATFIRVSASDGASYSITFGGTSSWRTACVVSYSGASTTTPQDATATENSGTTSTTGTALGLTTVTANAMLVFCQADFNGASGSRSAWSSPCSNEQVDFFNVGLADGIQVSAGASGNKTVTQASSQWAAMLLALRESGASPGGKAPVPRRRPLRVWNRRVA
jgi:hypothetical protein